MPAKPLHNIPVMLLGRSRTGKTTLITSMHDQVEKVVGQTNLRLQPQGNTQVTLLNYLTHMKNALCGNYMVMEGIKRTEGESRFDFTLGVPNQSPRLSLTIQDFPGEWMVTPHLIQEYEWVQKALRTSLAVLVTVDTPALMWEERGTYPWNEERNAPAQILELMQHTFARESKNTQKRLVMFTLTKCETYMQTKQSQEKMMVRFKEEYGALLEYLATEPIKERVAVVVLPVQTLGCVEILEIAQKNPAGERIYSPIFSKLSNQATYAPQDCDQLLRYLLRFAIQYANTTPPKGIWNRLRYMFTKQEPFTEAAMEFSNACKRTPPFEVVQTAGIL